MVSPANGSPLPVTLNWKSLLKAANQLWNNKEILQAVLQLPHPQIASSAVIQWLKSQAKPVTDPDLLIRNVVEQGQLQLLESWDHTLNQIDH